MAQANIDDVARRAGVSSATVSRALRGLPNVAESTRVRIEAIAKELNYQIDPQASRLATGKTMTIGLVAPWIGSWYTSQVITGAEQVLVDAGYDLLVASVPTSSLEPFLQRTRSFGRRLDGALLVDVYVEGEDLEKLSEIQVPIVTLGEKLGTHPSVSIDNEHAAFVATKYLLELGHRRIGLVRGSALSAHSSPVSKRREAGWRAAHIQADIAIDEALIIEGYDHVEGGTAAFHSLHELPDRPTAIFCMSDHMAFGVMTAAQASGVSIPADLSVVGFDDHTLAEAFNLTTMRQDVVSMGSTVATTLIQMIGGETVVPAVNHYPVELVIRSSTGPRRAI